MIFGSICAKWMSSLDSGLWLNIQCHYEILTTSSVDRRQVGTILTQRHFLNLLQNVGYILESILKKSLTFYTREYVIETIKNSTEMG